MATSIPVLTFDHQDQWGSAVAWHEVELPGHFCVSVSYGDRRLPGVHLRIRSTPAGHWRAYELCLTPADPSHGITSVDGANIAPEVDRLVNQAVLDLARRAVDPATASRVAQELNRKQAVRVDALLLARVAAIYNEATAAGMRPQKAVSELLGTGHSTTARYVRAARERGLIPPSTHKGAK